MRPTSPTALLRRLAGFTYDRPRVVGALLAGLAAAAAWGATTLRIDFSSTSFYRGDDDLVPALRAFQSHWGPDDDVVVVVVEAAGGDLLTAPRLRAIGDMADELAALAGVQAVESPADQRVVPRGRSIDEAIGLAELPADAEERLAILAAAPFVPLLLSADGRHAAVAVELAFSSDDIDDLAPAVDRISGVVAAHDGREGLALRLAGLPAIRAAFLDLTVRDQRIFIPVTLAIIGISLALVYRRLHAVVVPAVAAAFPVILTLGTMGLTGEPIGLLNQAYFTLLPVLAVADAVHLMSRYHEERAARGKRDAVVGAVEHVGLACLLTSSTTIVAFWSFATARMPIIRSFGFYAGIGMVYAYVTVIVLVPLLLRLLPAEPPAARDGRWLRAIGRVSTERPAAIVAVAVLAGAAMVLAGLRVTVDNRLLGLLNPDHPVRLASERVDRSLGGTLSLEVDLAGQPDAFLDPGVLAAARAFEDWAAAQPGVRTVLGPGRSVQAMAGAMAIQADTPERVRAVFDRLAFVVDTGQIVAFDYGRARVSVRTAERGGRAFERFADAAARQARAAFEPVGVEPVVTGTTLVASQGVNRVAENLRPSLLSVFGVVSLVFLALFRSVRVMVLAMLPNGLPLVVGYGAIGLLGYDLDPLSGVILSFGLGIAVDFTIHVLTRIREELREGDEWIAGIRHALLHSGRAVTVTSLVIGAGLATNVFSSFPPLQMLGLLGAIIMIAALACNLLLLPALLVAFRAGRFMSAGAARP